MMAHAGSGAATRPQRLGNDEVG